MKKRLFYFGTIAAVAVIIALVLYKLYSPGGTQQAINVPSPAASSSSVSIGGKIRLDVTQGTVQTVLKTLSRTNNYSQTYTVTSLWNGGQSVSTLNIWQKNDKTKMTVSQNNTVTNYLISRNDLYIWYNGSSSVFKSKLSDVNENSDIDRFSRQIRYEDIDDVSVSDIITASYKVEEDKPCIYAEYKSGTLGYVKHISVFIDSGLLYSAEIYDGETLVYSMKSDSTNITTPPDDVFNVPT